MFGVRQQRMIICSTRVRLHGCVENGFRWKTSCVSFCGPDYFSRGDLAVRFREWLDPVILLMVQRSQGQPPGIWNKPCKLWDKLPTSTGDRRISAINSINIASSFSVCPFGLDAFNIHETHDCADVVIPLICKIWSKTEWLNIETNKHMLENRTKIAAERVWSQIQTKMK